MIDAVLFDKLVCILSVTNPFRTLNVSNQEYLARGVRKNELPFGGIQVSRLHLHRLNITGSWA